MRLKPTLRRTLRLARRDTDGFCVVTGWSWETNPDVVEVVFCRFGGC